MFKSPRVETGRTVYAVNVEQGHHEIGTAGINWFDLFSGCRYVGFCIFAMNIHVSFARSQRSHFARKM